MSMLTLPDGRELEFTVSGPDDGLPLVFHHGTPGSHVPFRFLERAAHERGLRYMSAARPGYAHSTRRPGRNVADVVEDVVAVLDHLGADRCVTLGWSGGGPHALATVARLPERVTGAVSIAGVAPYGPGGMAHDEYLAGMGEQNIEEFSLTIDGEAALRPLAEEHGAGLRHVRADGLVAEMVTLLPPVDVAVMTDEMGEDLAANMREAFATGSDGWIDDDLLFVQPWGFEFSEIRNPTFVWQGTEDLMVPAAHGQWLATRIPDVTARLLANEGHVSIAITGIAQMLDELIATA